jgi:APA family basic amino acid/polyamine antiporter
MRIDLEPDSSSANTIHKEGPVTLARRLTLLDATLIVVGGVIGSAIFITPADVARQIPNPMFSLLLWVVAGLVALLAGFAFAELGAMFPEAGGRYVYIREVYGHVAAFIYGWILFTAGNSAGLAGVAMGFALFVGKVVSPLSAETVLYSHAVLPGITCYLSQVSLHVGASLPSQGHLRWCIRGHRCLRRLPATPVGDQGRSDFKMDVT